MGKDRMRRNELQRLHFLLGKFYALDADSSVLNAISEVRRAVEDELRERWPDVYTPTDNPGACDCGGPLYGPVDGKMVRLHRLDCPNLTKAEEIRCVVCKEAFSHSTQHPKACQGKAYHSATPPTEEQT